jgi:uncharacterized protein YndB with AHSA1/START domain
MSVEIHDGMAVCVTRRFDQDPAALFRAFTEPEIAARWMWAGLGSDPKARIDLRVGGRYRIAITADPADHRWPGPESAMEGVYIEIVPNTRLVYTVHWDADVGYNRPGLDAIDEAIIVEFLPSRAGTDLSIQHVGLPGDVVSAEAHAQGIEAGLDVLAALLSEIE